MQLERGGFGWGRQGQQSPMARDQMLGGGWLGAASQRAPAVLGSSGAGRPLTGQLFRTLPHLSAPGHLNPAPPRIAQSQSPIRN